MRCFRIMLAEIIICITICTACKKNQDVVSGISITSISPQSGKSGIFDTIKGKGFGTHTQDVQIFFNQVPASVVSVTDTAIIAIVPKNAGSGYIKLQNHQQEIHGPSFTYIYSVSVSTIAGLGYAGYEDGSSQQALFNYPRGIAIDKSGNIYVADFGNNRIRKITKDGIVSTIAGNGVKDYRDGPALDAEFISLNGLACDVNGTIYISDDTRVRKLSGNIVSTVAGNDNRGAFDGTGINASFNLPFGLVTDSVGNLFVSDAGSNTVRKIYNYNVTTIAGGTAGFSDGEGISAQFRLPGCLAIDRRNNTIFIADAGNFKIRTIIGNTVTTYAGDGVFGYKDGRFFEAEFKFPTGIAVDKKGNIFVCGEENAIREIDLSGNVTTIAGSGIRGYADGNGDTAMFNEPVYMLFDSNDVLYISDLSNHCIRKIVIE